MNKRLLPLLLRISAAIITIGAFVIFFLELRQGTATGESSGRTLERLVFMPLMTIGLALILATLADILVHAGETPDELSRSIARLQQQASDAQRRIDDIAVATDRLSRQRPAASAPAGPAHLTATLPAETLEPILRSLSDIREIALLTDSERRDRLAHMEQERRRMLVRQVIDHVEKQHWSDAGAALDTLDREHPNDPEVKRTRSQFEDARRNAEPGTVARIREQVENYISIGAWEQAWNTTRKLCDDFPGNVEAQRLGARVQRERDIHVETSVARMVEEIRHDIDRRLWRRALMHANRLMDKFPDHAKTQRVRDQLGTLRENAEIEERQELEVRIQELVRGHKFPEAIELSEELLQRFPNSPQAEAIETLLPRIRQLQEEEQAAQSG